MSVVGNSKGAVYQKLITLNGAPPQILPGGTGSNFIVDLGTNLQLVKSVSFNTVSFPNNIYNIYNDSRGSNNTYGYEFNPTYYTYTATPGFYTIGSLLASMNADLNTNTGGICQWSFNPTTNLVTFTYNGDGIHGGVLLNTGTNQGLLTTLGGGPLLIQTQLIGSIAPTVASVTATNFPNLSGPTHLFVVSETLAPSNTVEYGGRFSNTALCIPITASFGTLNVMECKQDDLCEITYSRPRDFSKIDIRLTDILGNVIDLHGGAVHLVLKVWMNAL